MELHQDTLEAYVSEKDKAQPHRAQHHREINFYKKNLLQRKINSHRQDVKTSGMIPHVTIHKAHEVALH